MSSNGRQCRNCRTALGEHYVTLHAPVRHDQAGDYCESCASLALKGWFRDRARFMVEHESEHAFAYPGARSVTELVRRSGSHFFDADTMRYFKSTLGCFYGAKDQGAHGMIYFATGERGPHSARAYTVRVINLTTCEINEPDEAGGFQACRTMAQAEDKAKRLAQGIALDKRRGCKKTLAEVQP